MGKFKYKYIEDKKDYVYLLVVGKIYKIFVLF